MIELHIADNDITNGSILVSWCIDKETIEQLKKEGADEPSVVIVIAPEQYHISKEVRVVAPLTDLMTYIPFRSAGENKIGAFITIFDRNLADKRYLTKNYDLVTGRVIYCTHILDSKGNWLESFERFTATNIKRSSEFINVDIPKESFAAEPSEWQKTWVNHFFKSKAFDQCDFRRRALFAYSVQPFLILGSLILRLIAALIALLIGSKAFSLKYLLHPLTYSLVDTFGDLFTSGSVFWRKFPANIENLSSKQVVRCIVSQALVLIGMPIISLPLLLLMYNGKTDILSTLFLVFIVGIITVVATILAIIKFPTPITVITAKLNKLTVITNITAKLNKSNMNNFYNESEQQLLVCNGQVKTKLSHLPKHKRTIKLRFNDLKSKVCRPFSL